MKKLLGIVVLGLIFCNTSFANAKIFECKQIIEIDDDIGEDIIIKKILEINLDKKEIIFLDNLFNIAKTDEQYIYAPMLGQISDGSQTLILNRYTLELKIIHNFKDGLQGTSVFNCDKLEKKI